MVAKLLWTDYGRAVLESMTDSLSKLQGRYFPVKNMPSFKQCGPKLDTLDVVIVNSSHAYCNVTDRAS
jgi:hypothetical protein